MMRAYRNFFVCLFFGAVFITNSFAQQPKLMLPIGHTEEITSARFSPDGKKVVTVSADKTAKIWDAESGALLADLKGHSAKVNFAIFSPDGKKIATASSDNNLKIWNTETGLLDTVLSGHKDEILSADFSPDGKKIITASSDGTARLWDAETWKPGGILTGHTREIVSVEFSPPSPDDKNGGNKILTASIDSTAKLWDAINNSVVTTMQGHASGLQFAHFSSDGKKIITVASSKKDTVKIKIWNAETGKLITDLKGDTSIVKSACFSSDGKKILTASQDQTAKIWDAETGKLDTVYDHDDAVVSAVYSPDGKKFITVSDLIVKLWDTENGKSIDLSGHTDLVRSAAFSADNKKIITASADKTAKIWDAASGSLLADLKGHTSAVKFACYSPDGRKIITASSDSIARIWDTKSGKFIAHLKGVNYKSIRFSHDSKKILTANYFNSVNLWDGETGKLDSVITGNSSSVNSAVFSPDSTKIVIASADKRPRLSLWDFPAAQYDQLIGHTGEVNSVEFSPDGNKLVSASSDNTAIIWNALTKQRIKKLEGHRLKVNHAIFSPDGKKIITSSLDNTIRIWDTENFRYDSIVVKGPNGVRSAWFSHDGKKILSVNMKFITIWDAATRKLISEITENNHQFTAACFSPDSGGKKILTIGDDDAAKIWDAETRKIDAILTGHGAAINSATFSPDGKNILTASDDNTVKIWDVKTGNVLYTFFAVDSTDYLVIDKDNHYDGTETARGLLYFTRGTQVISLSQLKDPLWMPGLAERLHKGDAIAAKSLEELDVFGNVIPEIEITNDAENEYRFSIKPGRDGIGEITLFVNKIEAKKFKKEQLIRNNGLYEVIIKKDASNNYVAEGVQKDPLNKYMVAGKVNWISLVAKTKDNLIASKEPAISFDADSSLHVIKPNLFAVMVGTSQYKSAPANPDRVFATDMNLSYPAIDAKAVSGAVEMAAKKMLNTDSVNHVFMYNLTTDSADALKPNKKNIKLILDSIGKKATVNDVLLIFLSGHGVFDDMSEKKQFYYMTADAADLNDEKAYPEVGISTDTLIEWIRLENIAANKRILILDACNSGGAIYDAIKNFDRMNKLSGLFILAASTSKESALENERYKHGYLTYSLLKVIKQLSDKLEGGRYLNIIGWFNEAQKIVPTLAKKEFNDQTPQLFIHTADFKIGEIDDTLINHIRLEKEKPLFVPGGFQNQDKHYDNLSFNPLVNKALDEFASTGDDPGIVYASSSVSPNAYSLSGTYTVKNNGITIENIKLIRDGELVKEFAEPLTGTTDKDKLKELAASLVHKAVQWVSENR